MKMVPWCEAHHRALQHTCDTTYLKKSKDLIPGTVLETEFFTWDLSCFWCPADPDECDAAEWVIKVSGETMNGHRAEKYLNYLNRQQ